MKFKIKSEKKRLPKKFILSVYFGVPGSGKTTFAAWLTKHDLKKGRKVWSNVPITGAYKVDCQEDLGRYMITGGRVIIDEAGIDFNNRDFKAFSKQQLKFFKYHRHYELAIDVFSQGYDDMDKKIRTLAQRYYVVKKSLIPFFVYRRRIGKRVGISEMTKEIIDEYFFVKFSRRYIFSPLLWRLFNTHSRDPLPEKEWEHW